MPEINVLDALVAYCQRHDAVPMNKHAGCWTAQIDDTWWIAINGHAESQTIEADGIKSTVPPFAFYIKFNGWPAGILTSEPGGQLVGEFAAGSLANLESFTEALQKAA